MRFGFIKCLFHSFTENSISSRKKLRCDNVLSNIKYKLYSFQISRKYGIKLSRFLSANPYGDTEVLIPKIAYVLGVTLWNYENEVLSSKISLTRCWKTSSSFSRFSRIFSKCSVHFCLFLFRESTRRSTPILNGVLP